LSIADCRLPKGWLTLWLSFVCLAVQAVAQEEAPALQPPSGEIPPIFWEQYTTVVILCGIAVLIVAALIVWLCLRPKPAVVLPPEVQARTALAALLPKPEDGKVISAVSQTLRRYVLAAFGLPPAEPTTAEFCQLIAQENTIGNEFSTALVGFLRECDERKFANAKPIAPLGAAARALKLVEEGEARRAQLRQGAADTDQRSTVSA